MQKTITNFVPKDVLSYRSSWHRYIYIYIYIYIYKIFFIIFVWISQSIFKRIKFSTNQQRFIAYFQEIIAWLRTAQNSVLPDLIYLKKTGNLGVYPTTLTGRSSTSHNPVLGMCYTRWLGNELLIFFPIPLKSHLPEIPGQCPASASYKNCLKWYQWLFLHQGYFQVL